MRRWHPQRRRSSFRLLPLLEFLLFFETLVEVFDLCGSCCCSQIHVHLLSFALHLFGPVLKQTRVDPIKAPQKVVCLLLGRLSLRLENRHHFCSIEAVRLAPYRHYADAGDELVEPLQGLGNGGRLQTESAKEQVALQTVDSYGCSDVVKLLWL